MIAILFATAREAAPFMQRHYCKPESANGLLESWACTTAAGRKAIVCVSGMGKVAAALAAQWLFVDRRCGSIVNAGVCGALVPDGARTPGQIYQIRHVVEGDHRLPDKEAEIHFCSPIVRSNLPSADLVTVDRPLFDDEIRRQMAEFGFLVDMEGAAVVRTAELYGRPVYLIKGVTDLAGRGQRRMLKANIDAVSVRLAEVVTSVIDYQL